jgi:hypothetical protein
MKNTKRWVVEGLLAGQVHIPNEENGLPASYGELKLTPYAFLVQNLHLREPVDKKIYLALEIPTNDDHVFIAWQEMETFIRALSMKKNVWISVDILGMTDKTEKWPEGIEFLKTRTFSFYKYSWQPVDHYRDIKNRVRNLAKNPPKSSGSLSLKSFESDVERMNNSILVNDDYISKLIKDYIMGLEEERSQPSLALLYFCKVLERVGKTEFGENLKKGFLSSKTMRNMIAEIGEELTIEENVMANKILRLRGNMSEAHLMVEGEPDRKDLFICKKMARFFVLKAINSKI